MSSPTLSVDNLPPFEPDNKQADEFSYELSDYLNRILTENGIYKSKNGVSLPSLMLLARFFKVSNVVVHDAMQILRRQGIEYTLQGLDDPILFWVKKS